MPCPDHRTVSQDHGGNTREVARRFGLDHVVDFSASINPLGQPPGLRERVFERWDEVFHYPDRSAASMRAAAAERHDLPAEQVLVGNGSAELIDLLLRVETPARLILCPPDFGLYSESAPSGLPIVNVPRVEAEGFLPDFEALAGTVAAGDLVLLSNPCNPSGRAAPPDRIRGLLDHCAQVGALLALDEAFCDFAPWASVLDGRECAHLVVFRSLTKFYAIPGLRMGYLVAPSEVVRRLEGEKVPWSVNALAQVAGAHCLADKSWDRRSVAWVARLRTELARQLESLPGLRPLESDVNYLLVRLEPPAPAARSIYEGMARRGVLIRHCGSFGLGERYVRVAVRGEEENALLVSNLGDLATGWAAGEGKP